MRNKILEIQKKYSDRLKLFQNFGYNIEAERDFILQKAEPISEDILEVGTGKGYLTLALARKGYRLITVDISDETQNTARSNIKYCGLEDRVRFEIADAKNLKFKDASFKTVFSTHTIHHLKEPYLVIEELLRVTKAPGKIILSDFSQEGFEVIRKVHQSQGGDHNSGEALMSEVGEFLSARAIKYDFFKSGLSEVMIGYKEPN